MPKHSTKHATTGPQASPAASSSSAPANHTPSTSEPTGTEHQPAKKRGPPKGSVNAIRHGLTAGMLPKGCKHIENQCNGLRRQLEDVVMEQKGEVSLVDAAIIQTALKWERHGALCVRWLRLKADELKPTEFLSFSRDIARASTERDRAINCTRPADVNQRCLPSLNTWRPANEHPSKQSPRTANLFHELRRCEGTRQLPQLVQLPDQLTFTACTRQASDAEVIKQCTWQGDWTRSTPKATPKPSSLLVGVVARAR